MASLKNTYFPHFVVFEGVDGSGKTTFAQALTQYYKRTIPREMLYSSSFPGSEPGTLGEWVYRFHHKRVNDAPPPESITPPALQLLHVAAHVEAILTHIDPTLAKEGYVILDRYWWSTYSYLRMALPAQQVWSIVNAERVFLKSVPQPIIIYLTRRKSLKAHELSPTHQFQLDTYYHELIRYEKQANPKIYEISNDGSVEQTWKVLLATLDLPYISLE